MLARKELNMTGFRRPLWAGIACAALWWAGAGVVQAAPAAAATAEQESAVLASGPGGSVTAPDLEAEVARRVPEKDRALFWSMRDVVDRYVRDLYAYHALAPQARAAGIKLEGAAAEGNTTERDRALVVAWLQQKARDAMPDDAAVRSWARSEYDADPQRFMAPEEVHVRHILLKVPPDATPEQIAAVKARAEDLRKQLNAGADFATLARKYSEDSGSAARGGELDWGKKGQWVGRFAKAAFALRVPGQIVGPVETRFGWHLIQLIQYQPEHRLSFEEALPQLRQQLETKLGTQEQRRLWEQATADVTLHQDAIQALAGRHLAESH